MEKFNGAYEGLLCKNEHDLQVEFDKTDNTFIAYCKKCGWSPEDLRGGYLDELFL